MDHVTGPRRRGAEGGVDGDHGISTLLGMVPFLRVRSTTGDSRRSGTRKRAIAVVLIATLAAGSLGATTWQTRSGGIRPVSHHVLLGVSTRGVTSGSRHPGRALQRYAKLVGDMPKIVMWYETWYAGPLISPDVMRAVRRHGAIPMITWMPKTSPSSVASYGAIAAGRFDGYLQQSATEARSWGHRVFVRPFHEMNGLWSPWAIGVQGNTPAKFIAAWRHIVEIFRGVDATNVRFVFSPNVISSTSPDFTAEYPGDDYVDWVALDGFNFGTSVPGQRWRSFRSIFAESYGLLAGLSTRPMMVSETACSERGGDKALWITHAFRRDMQHFPRIRAVVWFNHRKRTSWPITSSPAALQAYRAIVRAE